MTEAVEFDQAEEEVLDQVVETPEAGEVEEYDYSPPEHWTEDERAAYERLAQLNDVPWDTLGIDPLDGKELQKLWKERYSNWDKGFNKKMQEVAEQRKTFQQQQEQFQREAQAYQSLANLTRPYVQQWHSRGLIPDQVAAQAFHYATQFYQNPVGTLFEIAQQNGLLNEFLEHVNGQEYVDPRVEQLQRQNAQLQAQWEQYQQQQQQAQYMPYLQQIAEFQGATNEDGTPKYPYFQRLFGVVAENLKSGVANSLEEAYEQALWTIPEERERLLASQAQQKASAAQKEAERAEKASKRVKAKETGSSSSKSIGDELRAQLDAAWAA